jgi:hypothetical protein
VINQFIRRNKREREGTSWAAVIFFGRVGSDSCNIFQVLEYLEIQDALSAGPDFLGAVGILHASPVLVGFDAIYGGNAQFILSIGWDASLPLDDGLISCRISRIKHQFYIKHPGH